MRIFVLRVKRVHMYKTKLLQFLRIFVLCFFVTTTYAQKRLDTLAIYNHARNAPVWINSNTEQLAEYLRKPFSDDASKVLAFAYWISSNIQWKFVLNQTNTIRAQDVLGAKSSNSEGIAVLMHELCKVSLIPSEIVYGYVRDFDYSEGDTLWRSNHAWNVVKIKNDWHFFDIAYASGRISFVPKSNISFTQVSESSPEFSCEFVQDYNPYWFSLNPNKSIETHFPLHTCMQLRSQPVPFSVFLRGSQSVQKYISAYHEQNQNNTKLNSYYELHSQKKYLQTAYESERENPLNVRDKAFWLYTAVYEIKTDAYLEYVNRIFARFHVLRPMREQTILADSLLLIAIQQNSAQFQSKKKKSETWRSNVLLQNKFRVSKCQEYIKMYTGYRNSLSRLENQCNSLLSFLSQSAQKFSEHEIIDVGRPFVHLNAEMYERVFLLLAVDSLATRKQKLLLEYTQSLQNSVSLNYLQNVYAAEQRVYELCEQNRLYSVSFLEKSYAHITCNFYDKELMSKSYFAQNMKSIDSIQSKYASLYASDFLEAQNIRFEIIRDYIRLSIEQLKYVKDAKKKSYVNVGEDSIYSAILLDFVQQCRAFSSDIEMYIHAISQFQQVFHEQMQEFNLLLLIFKNEDRFETARHSEYIKYITNIRNAEQEKLQYMRAELKAIKKLIDSELE